MAAEDLEMRCLKQSFRCSETMLNLCLEYIDGPIVNVLANSKMIFVY